MARFKYLVNDKGIDWIREMVEKYSTVKIQPWMPIPPWEFKQFLGWQE